MTPNDVQEIIVLLKALVAGQQQVLAYLASLADKKGVAHG
jgi:hypothetical protein